MRRGLEGERLSIYATIPAFKDLGTNLDAGNLSEKELALAVRVVDGLSKGDEQCPTRLSASTWPGKSATSTRWPSKR